MGGIVCERRCVAMKLCVATALLACACVAMASEEAQSKVVILGNDFALRVSEGNWFVMLETEFCGHCKALEPELEALAQRLDGRVNVGRADVDKHPEVAQVFNARGYPL